MSIPGGENPNKVKNIVGGSWDRFGDLYGRLFGEICGVGGGGVVDGGRRGEDGEVWLQVSWRCSVWRLESWVTNMD